MKLGVIMAHFLVSLALLAGGTTTIGRPNIDQRLEETLTQHTPLVSACDYEDFEDLFKRAEHPGAVERTMAPKGAHKQDLKFVKVLRVNPSREPPRHQYFRLMNSQIHSGSVAQFRSVVLYNDQEAWLHLHGIHPRGAQWMLWSPTKERYSYVRSIPMGHYRSIRFHRENVYPVKNRPTICFVANTHPAPTFLGHPLYRGHFQPFRFAFPPILQSLSRSIGHHLADWAPEETPRPDRKLLPAVPANVVTQPRVGAHQPRRPSRRRKF
ncbi:hypothetical protein PCANC_07266 [Puccinia coronata f. sp. avenae]|uniref:Plastocyanin-like domain-containing protein n=1 Tax=Puccinia coronata f. sp. avenae TaxID=200324 RepID=A0A2N5UY42_9BASI|nr:hypothetical protein PCASD_08490 [Puccinia coronata f. sp. avenae]PLW52772.1 hypothetical protein PCANC_07266 [Puccinia coronata f. sp. avenae]